MGSGSVGAGWGLRRALEDIFDALFQVRNNFLEKPGIVSQPAIIAGAGMRHGQAVWNEIAPAADGFSKCRAEVLSEPEILSVTANQEREFQVGKPLQHTVMP